MNAVGDKLYVIGGRANENIVFNDVHVYDTGLQNSVESAVFYTPVHHLATNAWSTPGVRGNPPEARDFHSTVLLGDDKVDGVECWDRYHHRSDA